MVKLKRAIFTFSSLFLFGLVLVVSGVQGEKQKWQELRYEKVTILPLTPIPRQPTLREWIREGRQPIPGGPAMAIVKGQHIYVVDDVRRKLLECSMKGKVLRKLSFPKDAPKSLSGVLSLCGNLLWVGFESVPYAFAVDLTNWMVIEERSWRGKGVVAGLFAMPDRTLYAVMPGRDIKKSGVVIDVIWQLIKIAPDGSQQEQIVEGWRPSFVDTEGNIYWVNQIYPTELQYELKVAYSKFGKKPELIGEIFASQYKVRSMDWICGGPVVGVTKEGVLTRGIMSIQISKKGEYRMPFLFLRFHKDRSVKVIGEEPTFGRPIRSLDLPDWWICEGKIYAIMRETVGEHSRFWLVRLKL